MAGSIRGRDAANEQGTDVEHKEYSRRLPSTQQQTMTSTGQADQPYHLSQTLLACMKSCR